MKQLHITNGDQAAGLIGEALSTGELLPWRDVLHEGPVPSGLGLEELSRLRARFHSSHPWGGPFEEILSEFAARDAMLKSFRRYDEITLWFEHDLYDQLQLLQLLHWFSGRADGGARLRLVCVGDYPGVDPFHGLAQLTPPQLAGLFEGREAVGEAQLELGRRAFDAFSASHPDMLKTLVADEVLGALPFLRAALLRQLEQYPSTRNGLSRTEQQILTVLAEGVDEPRELFLESQISREEAPFMGDLPFLLHLERLSSGTTPLVRFVDGRPIAAGRAPGDEDVWTRKLELTEAGSQVGSGQADFSRFHRYDRWVGGVHLVGDPVAWRFNRQRGVLEEQTA